MEYFLLKYILFVIKYITAVLLFSIFIILIFYSIKFKNKDSELIKVENLNYKYKKIKKTIEKKILTKKDYNAINRAGINCYRSKMFIVVFNGDVYAKEVHSLRKIITSILLVASTNDEVFIMLNSSGGLVHNYGLGASQLKRITDRGIKLTVSVDLIAASGGYMMASVANNIIAAPFSIIGSIGVLIQTLNFNKALSKYNIDVEHHTAGKHKSTLTMLGKNDNEGRKKLKEELENTHFLFKKFIKANRDKVEIDDVSTGEYWYGEEALKLNLIDKIQTSDEYLLEKSKDTSLHEIKYITKKSLKEITRNTVHKTIKSFIGALIK